MTEPKSRIIILPTADIVKECQSLDSFFHFLRGGVKSVVREAIHAYCQRRRNPMDSIVVSEILKQYERYLQSKQQEDEEAYRYQLLEVSPTFSIEEYLDNVGKIEHVVTSMEEMVNDMLEGIFHRTILNIHEKGSGWIHHDYYAPFELALPATGRQTKFSNLGDRANYGAVHPVTSTIRGRR